MLLGIDHLVIATPDPDAAAEDMGRALGLKASGGGRHEALGTFNRLIWLGDSFVELIGVFDRGLAKGSWTGRPTLQALASGAGLATWAIATDDIERDSAALRSLGSDLQPALSGQRARPDGRVVQWRFALPPTLGPSTPPFLIEHDATAAEWTAADRLARAAEVHPIGGPVRLEVLEIPVDDFSQSIQGFTRTVGLRFRPSLAGAGARDASVGEQILRLRPRRAARPSLPTVLLSVRGGAPRSADAVGCHWLVRAG
ncbi:MAG TPA: VOC family protein [Candidatus Limnocylindrales bacterium]